jgi:hypothetical protein
LAALNHFTTPFSIILYFLAKSYSNSVLLVTTAGEPHGMVGLLGREPRHAELNRAPRESNAP